MGADFAGDEQKVFDHTSIVRGRLAAQQMHQYGRYDAGCAIGGCGHDASEAGVLLVHRQGEHAQATQGGAEVLMHTPQTLEPLLRTVRGCAAVGLTQQLLIHRRRATDHMQPTGQFALAIAALMHGAEHDLPQLCELRINGGIVAPGAFIGANHLGDAQRIATAVFEQISRTAARVR